MGATQSPTAPADRWPLPRCGASAPTEETDVPEWACRCHWQVTDGNLIRLLLGSLIKVMCRKKSGGGSGILPHWGKRAVGIALAAQGQSLNPRSLLEAVPGHLPGPQAGGEQSLCGSSITLGQRDLSKGTPSHPCCSQDPGTGSADLLPFKPPTPIYQVISPSCRSTFQPSCLLSYYPPRDRCV